MVPFRHKILKKEKRAELEQSPSNQIDTNATFTKKANKWYFGYKGHVGVGLGSKIIRKRAFITASVSDSKEFLNRQSGDEKSVLADKGSPNKILKKLYNYLGIFWGVLDKANKNKSLSKTQKKCNKKLSKVRAGVEHVFGYIKERFGFRKTGYKNKKRNGFKFDMSCILYNINRVNYLTKKAI